MPQPSIPIPKGCTTSIQPDQSDCDKILSGSTINTGSYRCDTNPICAANYTYDSSAKKCKINPGYHDGPQFIDQSCPINFQMNNLKMCETNDNTKPSNKCADPTYVYKGGNMDYCCPGVKK